MKEKFKSLIIIFNRFKFTYISSVLIGISYFLFSNTNKLFDIISSFLIPFCITTFLIETLYTNKKKKICYLLSIFISLINFLLTSFNIFVNTDFYTRISILYYLVIILLSIYYNYKNTNKSFSKYLISCFSNIIKLVIIYFVLNVGIVLLLLLIDSLIFNNIFSIYIDKVLVLILFVYFIPGLIYSIHNYNEVTKFISILVSKIMFTLIIIAYLIIYIYIIKILVTLSMPSNVIFRIILILFIIHSFVYIMSKSVEKNKIFLSIHKILIYLFIPLIFLQIYSLGIRIINNGFTIFRYFGIISIIFEIIYIIFCLLDKDESKLIFVIIIELIISLIIPFINCYDISINSQYKYLLEYKKDNKLTQKVNSSYMYLLNYYKGKKLINNLLTDEDKKIISSYDEKEEPYDYYLDTNIIDIEGYKTIEFINESSENKINYPIILERIDSCLMDNKDDCFENNNNIILENCKIIVKSIYTYNMNDSKYYDISYYLLKK